MRSQKINTRLLSTTVSSRDPKAKKSKYLMFSILKSISVGAQLVSQQETVDISNQKDGSGEY